MISAWRTVARTSAALVAVLAVVLGFTMSGPAFAGGNGSGNANENANANANANASAEATTTTSTSNGQGNGKSATAGSNGQGAGNSSSASDKKAGGSSTASDHQTSGTAGTSGNVGDPQPQSNADQNSGGANGKCPGGPYCSTRDGSASANGNGGGKSTGKPCAGCVGKADNKNPQGQKPGPQDHNNGYECDGNNGIAKTNPAHTGCTSGTTTTEKCVPKANEYVDANGNCVKKTDDNCVPKANEYVDANGNCVKKTDDNCVPTQANNFCAGGNDTCVPGQGEMVNDQGECVPVCPTDSSIPMDDEDCNPSVLPEEETPGSNRPATVAGVEQFAGPQPPAGVEQFAGPSAAVGPTGILPSTGATTLMNALGATGFGLLVLGSALLLRRKAQQA